MPPKINLSVLEPDNITFTPAGAENFQRALLQTRRAQVTAYNASGGVVWSKPWNATKLTAKSRLIGNIMTRADIRYAPDASSIVRLHAEVLP
ncbi:hypothetical protein [Hymenobacter swuensis]|uniref:Uncharacterized protein n=1 Tax=Hymenobacter swuensis DY53 TaxID=1227739 RepID=W8ESM8_9BACT|nr:hypothetical protein [Hymenobacter swuensis]AHJ95528.1 hypothetical protein Hsw_PA0195 [Hymenobacter swuensis DY53]